MKQSSIKIFVAIFIVFILVNSIYALEFVLKLPYEKGEKFIVTRGYNTYPTHKPEGINKYALDFTKDGCKAYGKQTLATTSGVVKGLLIENSEDKKRGYGNAVKIDHGSGLESIYAHLTKFIVEKSQEIKQGQIVGYIGNTGNVEGQACPEYPGTHLHFAMYQRQIDGKLVAYKPEPMSAYTNFLAGNWYVSDNEIFQTRFAEEIPTESGSSEVGLPKNFWWTLGSLFSGLWQNITGPISNLLGMENNTQGTKNGESKSESSFTDTKTTTDGIETFYDAKLTEKNPNQDLTIKENETLSLFVKFKNTGATTWKKEIVSLNIASEEAKKFYHPSWLTQKRPTRLNENEVKPNEIGSFDFLIIASNLEPAIYNSSFRPVYQDETGFHWLGAEIVSWRIAFQEQEKKITLDNLDKLGSLVNIELGNLGNLFNNQEEKGSKEDKLIEEKPEPIYPLGSGGGGASSPLPQDTTSPEITLTPYPKNPTNLQTVTFEFSANEPATFKCKLDENEKEDCSSPKIYENLSEGEYSFFLEAFDTAGNQTSLVYVWQIDLTAPRSIINTSGTFNNENLPQFIEGIFDGDDTEKIEISLRRKSDEKFLSQNSPEFIWQEGEVWLSTELNFENKTWRFKIPREIFLDDIYKIYSQSKDKVGNLEEPIPVSSFIFDATPPEKIANVNLQKEKSNLIFSWFEVVDNFSGLDFYEVVWQEAEEMNFVPIRDLIFTLPIDEKKGYYFKVRAVDLAGNQGEWSDIISFQPLPYLGNWQKRKVVIIDNTNNENDLLNYEVNIPINYQPEMNSDFSDLRFTDEDGQTSLNYGWDIDDEGMEKKVNGVLAEAVVKVPTIPAQSQKRIYLYYGNLEAQPVADLENTLTWFDHFDYWQGEKYEAHDVWWDEINSRVRLSTRSCGWLSPKLSIKNFWLKSRMARGGGYSTDFFWRFIDPENTWSLWQANTWRAWTSGWWGSAWGLRENGLWQEKGQGLGWDGSFLIWEIKTFETKHTVKIGEIMAGETIDDHFNEPGKIIIYDWWSAPWWVTWWGDWAGYYTLVDYLYIRQYVEPEPIVYFE